MSSPSRRSILMSLLGTAGGSAALYSFLAGQQPFQVREGYVEIPHGPGLGIELDENALANKIGHDWQNREAYDEFDGSVVDW